MIRTGGGTHFFRAGDAVTPAELSAIQQVLGTGKQNLVINSFGAATGGNLFVHGGAAATPLANLVVPQNVTVLTRFDNGNVSILGNLTNYGSLYAFVTQSVLQHQGTISASNIINDKTGLISSILPPNIAQSLSASTQPFDLTLSALNAITNHGVISSSGSLKLSAPAINNEGGTMSAAQAITICMPDLVVTAYGGNYISREFNVNALSADIKADNISGVVNTSGSAVHVATNNGLLTLGNINLVGDPTYYNTGDIIISSDISSFRRRVNSRRKRRLTRRKRAPSSRVSLRLAGLLHSRSWCG